MAGYHVIIIANSILQGNSVIVAGKIEHLVDKWRCSREMVESFPVIMECWDGKEPTAYVEPNEINGICRDFDVLHWDMDIFTTERVAQEQHLMIIDSIYLDYLNTKNIVVENCVNIWCIPTDVCGIIWEMAEAHPGKIQFDRERLKNQIWATSDRLSMCCKPCTVHRDNPIYNLIAVTDQDMDEHERSLEHLKAIEKQNEYYDELENWMENSETELESVDTMMKVNEKENK